MSITPTNALLALAAASLAVGCTGTGAGTPLDSEVCATDDLFVAEQCGETYCGPPEVQVGTGADGFLRLDEGDDVDIVFGSQGGYHLDVSASMTRLCPIVYVRASIWLDRGDGSALERASSDERHMEAIRTESEEPSEQQVWGVQARIDCEYWPDTQLTCPEGAGSAAHLEDFEVVLRVEAEDHNGRIATDERHVQPVCCGG